MNTDMIMDKPKRYYRKTKEYFIAKPKMLIPAAFIVFLLCLVIFESARASYYQKSIREYKNSVAVLGIKDTADKLNVATQASPPAIYCDVSHEGLLQEINEAYQLTPDDSQPRVLVAKLSQQIKNAGSPPAFNSILQFVPSVRRARQTSQQIHGAIRELTNLTDPDVRSEYCTGLIEVLSEIYFLPGIDSPEGVSGLFIGQQENFQVNTGQAQELLLEIVPPTMFVDQHVEINGLLNKVALDLRENGYRYDEFSRRIEEDVRVLESILGDIGNKSKDLQARPSQIAIQANILE